MLRNTHAAGNVYVADQSNRIQKFTGTGAHLTQWGTFGGGNGQFQYPNAQRGRGEVCGAVGWSRGAWRTDAARNLLPDPRGWRLPPGATGGGDEIGPWLRLVRVEVGLAAPIVMPAPGAHLGITPHWEDVSLFCAGFVEKSAPGAPSVK